jgi:hypothetical protein
MVSLVTKQFEAHYHNQNINTVILLDPDLVYANLRLINLKTDQFGNGYNFGAGAYSLIKNIRLMDGNTQIDELQDAFRVLRFKNTLRMNKSNYNLGYYLDRSPVGYSISKINSFTQAVSRQTVDGNKEGYLELNKCFGFLQDNPLFKLKQPKVIIEWNLELNNVFSAPRPGNLNILPPSLIADEILDPNLLKLVPSTYVYKSLEYDRTTIKECPATQQATQRVRIDGFNKRLCGRGLIMTYQPSNFTQMDGNVTSYTTSTANNENYQFFVDNKQLLPSPETKVSKQQRVNDLWGSMNINYEEYIGKLDTPLSVAAGSPLMLRLDGNLNMRTGMSSYGAIDFSQQRFEDLQLEYNRTADATLLPALEFRLYVEVLKALTFNSDGDSVVNYL